MQLVPGTDKSVLCEFVSPIRVAGQVPHPVTDTGLVAAYEFRKIPLVPGSDDPCDEFLIDLTSTCN